MMENLCLTTEWTPESSWSQPAPPLSPTTSCQEKATFIGTSVGNDGFAAAAHAAFKAATGNKSDGDVLGSLILNYINVKANGNGVDIIHINISRPNGSIPGMIVSKMTAKQAEQMSRVVAFLKTK